MSETLTRVALARRPEGAVTVDDFRIESGPVPEPAEGEVLVKVRNLSLDPYMRGRMTEAKSYAASTALGDTMIGGATGEVLVSRAEGVAEGDLVYGMLGWASHAVLPADELRKLDPSVPETTALGVLGMPGFTAWYALKAFGRPKAGETLVVAAATGPVGSMVGQLARRQGLRVVGIAGGEKKCRLATETFGFDACLDHYAHDNADDLRSALAGACPDGIDIYYENVGGMVLEAVLPLMNTFGRIPICGTVAWYGAGSDSDVDRLPLAWRTILVRRMSVRGFIIFDHWDHYPQFLAEMEPLVKDGEIRYLEDVAEGLEAAPGAFVSMLKGGNLGKQVVRVS